MSYAYKYTKNRDLAQDLVQTTYMRAIRSQHTFNVEEGGNLGAWLMTILKNVIKEYYKVKNTRRPLISDESIEEVEMYNAPQHIDVYDEGVTFQNEKLEKEYNKLPSIYKEIIRLTYVEEHNNDNELAKLLDLLPNTVRTRRRNAKKILRKRMVQLDPIEYYNNNRSVKRARARA